MSLEHVHLAELEQVSRISSPAVGLKRTLAALQMEARWQPHFHWAGGAMTAQASWLGLSSGPSPPAPSPSAAPNLGSAPGALQSIVPSCSQPQASQVALVVKNPPPNAGDPGDTDLIPGSDDPLEEGMATHSSILTWRIPWTEEPGGLQSMGSQRVGHN